MALKSLCVSLCGLASAASILPRQDGKTVTVDLSVDRGTPNHYGAGVLLGFPDPTWPGMSADQIPDRFYEQMAIRYHRGGGSQLPDGAWTTGLGGYYARMNSSKSDYDKARSFGASWILMSHDVFGTDQITKDDTWPGDNGDWTDYYAYLDQVLSDLVRLDMLEELSFDIWNEPDVDIFWKRSVEQWVELYVRTHQYIRERSELDGMQIMGPSMQEGATAEYVWWSQWLQAVSENGIPPDQYSYHLLYGDNVDLRRYNKTLVDLLAQYGLPERQVNVNEYARPEEQVPSTSAWFISRFERYDTFGLRANWASGCQLHDFLANLVTKPGAPDSSECGESAYEPNGQWHAYAYYGTNMTGRRVASEGSDDGVADAFATVDEDRVRILVGVRQQTGTWQLEISGLGSVGLPESGVVNVQTYAFKDQGLYAAVAGPEDRGVNQHKVTGGTVTFPIYSTEADIDTAFAFEIVL